MTLPRLLTATAMSALWAASCLSGTAHAQGQPGPISNGMGQQIFFSPSGQPFRAAATDPYPVALWFAQADTDHDGKISSDEFTNDAKLFFVKLDLNHDGYVNSPENTNYETRIAPEITRVDPRISQPKNHISERDPNMGADQDPTHGRYQKMIQGASQYGLIDEPQPVRGADGNIDFRVSGAEWIKATTQRFALLDRNGDGFLMLDELPKTPFQYALEDMKAEQGKGDKEKKKRFGW